MTIRLRSNRSCSAIPAAAIGVARRGVIVVGRRVPEPLVILAAGLVGLLLA